MIEPRVDAVIEVRSSVGDVAWAEGPEAAFVAARTLLDDAYDHHPFQGFDPTVTFYVDGEPVLFNVPAPMVWATLAHAKQRARRRA